MDGETVNVGGTNPTPTPGSAGVSSQVSGAAATVSNLAGATGGIDGGNLVQPDLDEELYKFKGDDTPLMQIALKAKRVKVTSPEVDHYMIDEPRTCVTTTAAVAKGTSNQFVVSLDGDDQQIPRPYGTLLAVGVDGYTEDGSKATPGKDLMLFVVGHDPTTGNPICRAVNGPKSTTDAEYCTTPAIPAGTKLILLGNALYETQKKVDPDLFVPQPTRVFLQKRGMNRIVSDYFDAVKKRIPFTKAIIAEAALTKFKCDTNRSLLAGRKGKIKVNTPEVGVQDIYFSEGVRYQVKKEIQHIGKWTYEEFIALAKMFFTGEDVPSSGLTLCGKNFLENIQCIDFSKHPEVKIDVKTNKFGWTVTAIHTVFGDIEFKREPTFDRLGWSNSAFLLSPDRLVRYVLAAEHSSSDRVEGEEATRESILTWDAIALKGSCHLWINGEDTTANDNVNEDAAHYLFYEGSTAPESPVDGGIYYLLSDCPGIAVTAVKGTLWRAKNTTTTTGEGASATTKTTTTWSEYEVGDVISV